MVGLSMSPSTKLGGGGRSGEETSLPALPDRKALRPAPPNSVDTDFGASWTPALRQMILLHFLRSCCPCTGRDQDKPPPLRVLSSETGLNAASRASRPTGQDVKRGMAAWQVGENPGQRARGQGTRQGTRRAKETLRAEALPGPRLPSLQLRNPSSWGPSHRTAQANGAEEASAHSRPTASPRSQS